MALFSGHVCYDDVRALSNLILIIRFEMVLLIDHSAKWITAVTRRRTIKMMMVMMGTRIQSGKVNNV